MDMKLAICQGPSLGQAASGLAAMEAVAVLSVLNSQCHAGSPVLSSLEPVIEHVNGPCWLPPCPVSFWQRLELCFC